MSPLAKGLGLLFGLPVILAVVFFAYFNATGADRMKQVCGQIRPGMSLAQLQAFVADNRLGEAVAADSGTAVLGNERSYGRHRCKVTLAAGAVTAAEYLFAD